MQIFLIILLVFVLLFGIVLFSAVKFKIYLSKDGYIVIRYLFFSFKYDIYGDTKITKIKKKGTKTQKQDTSKNPKKKEGYFKRLYSEEGIIEGTVKLLSTIKHIVSKIIELITECNVSKLVLDIKVATEDPAETAICYGGVCSVVYPALGFLNGMTNIKKQNVSVVADYNLKNPEVSFIIILKLRIFKAIRVAFSLIKDLI